MNNPMANSAAEDSAWASIKTPLSVEELVTFCHNDVERLFRINPLLEFKAWQTLGDKRYRFAGKNISQQPPFEFDTELQVKHVPDGIEIKYASSSLKTGTTFKIEAAGEGSTLTITDHYHGHSQQERQRRLGEVDKSITTWAEYLQRYLLDWQRWSRFGPWRWYMRRVWQPMKPTARRITYMILWITVVEIALIALGVAIYFAEYA
jgi:hypothetical protein